jgi:GTP-binding protein
MAKPKKLPVIAICGRPNVGKSTLFNRIIGKQRAIVHAEEGITRDRAYGVAEWEGKRFRLVDTGGIVENPIDPILKKMQEQVRLALEESSAIIFVIDGQQELTKGDKEIAEELFKYGKPIFLAVNKLDNPKLEENRFDFYAIGMGEPYAISATHGIGVDILLDAVVEKIPARQAVPEPEPEGEEAPPEPAITRVAVIGKPNVGKSSFINAILNEERLIVDNTPGTTRDAIDIEFRWNDKDYLLVDTAGLRKKAGIRKHVEFFSVARSLRAVRQADVCLILMDATEGITEQDKRILDYVLEQGTAMILVWTKWDLIENKDARLKALNSELEFKAGFLKNVPVLTISNVTRQRLFKTFDYVDRVAEEAQKRISTAELNRLMEEIRSSHTPPSYKGKYAKILYATQAGVKPTTFVLFVNQKRLFHFSYMRFIENRIREKYGFEGVPVHVELREEKHK